MLPTFTAANLHTVICGSILLAWAWTLGSIVGLQREIRGHPAGLRTHAVVCGAACLLSILSFPPDGHGDSGRVAAQAVTGIGFLGAGVIMRRGVSVHGLTTAATVWLVAAVGIAVGAGVPFAILATVTALLSMFTLIAAKPLEKRLAHHAADRRGESAATVTLTAPRSGSILPAAFTALTTATTRVSAVETDPTPGETNSSEDLVTARVTVHTMGSTPDRAALSRTLEAAAPGIGYEWDDGTAGNGSGQE